MPFTEKVSQTGRDRSCFLNVEGLYFVTSCDDSLNVMEMMALAEQQALK